MYRPRSKTKRLVVLVAGAVAAVTGTAIFAGGSSAQPQSASRSLTLFATSTGEFDSPGKPHLGATSGFADRLRSSDRFVTGRDIGVCTLDSLTRRESFCRVQMQLSNGQLSLQGIVREDVRSFVFVVIGGSGAYKGAGGEARITTGSNGKTRIGLDLTH